MNFTRNLNFRIDGRRETGKLWIGDLEFDEKKNQWICYWSLAFVHPEVGRFHGTDPLDAVGRTLDFISTLILGSIDDGLQIWWQYEGDNAGVSFDLYREAFTDRRPTWEFDSEKDAENELKWKSYRETSDDLRFICLEAVRNCKELDPTLKNGADAIGSIRIVMFDRSYLEFLEDQIALAPRGPSEADRLRKRVSNLSGYAERELANFTIPSETNDCSIYVDPLSASVIHWEEFFFAD